MFPIQRQRKYNSLCSLPIIFEQSESVSSSGSIEENCSVFSVDSLDHDYSEHDEEKHPYIIDFPFSDFGISNGLKNSFMSASDPCLNVLQYTNSTYSLDPYKLCSTNKYNRAFSSRGSDAEDGRIEDYYEFKNLSPTGYRKSPELNEKYVDPSELDMKLTRSNKKITESTRNTEPNLERRSEKLETKKPIFYNEIVNVAKIRNGFEKMNRQTTKSTNQDKKKVQRLNAKLKEYNGPNEDKGINESKAPTYFKPQSVQKIKKHYEMLLENNRCAETLTDRQKYPVTHKSNKKQHVVSKYDDGLANAAKKKALHSEDLNIKIAHLRTLFEKLSAHEQNTSNNHKSYRRSSRSMVDTSNNAFPNKKWQSALHLQKYADAHSVEICDETLSDASSLCSTDELGYFSFSSKETDMF